MGPCTIQLLQVWKLNYLILLRILLAHFQILLFHFERVSVLFKWAR